MQITYHTGNHKELVQRQTNLMSDTVVHWQSEEGSLSLNA